MSDSGQPRRRRASGGVLLALALLLPVLGIGAAEPVPVEAAGDAERARVELGRRLFDDERFASSRGDFATSCRSCHLLTEDPQGLRAFTDFLSRSWMPWRSDDARREYPRNTPILLDVGDLEQLHLDGEFPDLESLVSGTLTGRVMGWLPGEEVEAAATLRRILRHGDAAGGEGYHDAFAAAFAVDLELLDAEATLELSSRAVAAFLRTLRAPRDSAWDRFVARHRLPPGPGTERTPGQWAAAVLDRLEAAEAAGELQLGDGFDRPALEGLRVFLRGERQIASAASGPEATTGVGACVRCHVPPDFTDGGFHNVGVSQLEYDRVHGEGAFARYPLPERRDPDDDRTRRAPDRRRPEWVDLGRWNRLGGSHPEAGLAAFRTPTLRNLAYSSPYLHDGGAATVEEAIEAHARAGELARRGELRAPARGLEAIRLGRGEIEALAAFLATLGDVLVPGEPLPPFPGPVVGEPRGDDDYPRY